MIDFKASSTAAMFAPARSMFRSFVHVRFVTTAAVSLLQAFLVTVFLPSAPIFEYFKFRLIVCRCCNPQPLATAGSVFALCSTPLHHSNEWCESGAFSAFDTKWFLFLKKNNKQQIQRLMTQRNVLRVFDRRSEPSNRPQRGWPMS